MSVFKSKLEVIVRASMVNDSQQGEQHQIVAHQSYCDLLSRFGYKNDYPVAEFLKRYYGLTGHWHIVSPIHWEATQSDATIRFADGLLQITDEESKHLFNEFSAFAAQDEIRLFYHDAVTWLIETPKPIAKTQAVHELIDRSFGRALQDLESTPFWLRFLTESQMFFSAFKSIVNGIWIWGGTAEIELRKRSSRPLIVCGDEHWLGVVSALSSRASCFNEKQPILSNTLYFVPNAHWLKVSNLEQYFSHVTVRWYWQNGVYKTKPAHWFYRLLGR